MSEPEASRPEDELDARLAGWGSRTRAAIPPAPTARERVAPRREWLAPVAAAIVVVALAGGVSLLASQRESAPAPVADAASEVVPYADLPYVEPPMPSPLREADADVDAPDCATTDLAVRYSESGPALTSWSIGLDVANTGSAACRLSGVVTAVSGAQDGVDIKVDVAQSKENVGRPPVLSPGESRLGVLTWDGRCDLPGQRPRQPLTDVRLSLVPGGPVPAMAQEGVNGFDLQCLPMDGVLFARPWSTLAGPVYVPGPLDDLTIGVRAPATATPGELLRYTVRLSNPTDAPVALTPCPSYVQGSPLGKRANRLNCAEAPEAVPAGGYVDFAMELPVAADAPRGAQPLGWSFAGVQGEPAQTTLEVQGGTATPQCGAPGNGPPCDEGMELLRDYPLAVDVHCGLTELRANGRLWRPVAGPVESTQGNPPEGWGNPVDSGRVRLIASDRLLYVSSTGQSVPLSPLRPTTAPIKGTCE